MKKRYYFQAYPDPDSGTIFLIAEKTHFDKTGYFDDDIRDDLEDTLGPLGFYDLEETTYEYDGPPEDGRQKLLQLGMVEKQLT